MNIPKTPYSCFSWRLRPNQIPFLAAISERKWPPISFYPSLIQSGTVRYYGYTSWKAEPSNQGRTRKHSVLADTPCSGPDPAR